MPAFTILFGVALIAVGVGTYAGSESQDIGGLLPALFGLVALTLGVASIAKKDLRMHLMHAAVLLATLGVLIPLIRLVIYLVELDRDTQMNLIRVILTVAFSAAYVFTAVQSFRAARRSGKVGTAPAKESPAERTDTTAEG